MLYSRGHFAVRIWRAHAEGVPQVWRRASRLLDHHVNLVSVFHFQRLGRVVFFDALSVEDKTALVVGEALSLAVGVHQLFELS